MENIIQATVLGARCFDIEGNKIGSMFISQPVERDRNDYIGHEVMKVSCPYQLIEVLRHMTIPGQYYIRVKMKTAAGGKVGLEVLSLEAADPVNPGKGK